MGGRSSARLLALPQRAREHAHLDVEVDLEQAVRPDAVAAVAAALATLASLALLAFGLLATPRVLLGGVETLLGPLPRELEQLVAHALHEEPLLALVQEGVHLPGKSGASSTWGRR